MGDMMTRKLCEERRIIREGGRTISERTDSEYYDKYLAKLIQDIKACPKEWLDTMLAGIDARDWKALKEKGFVKDC